MYIVVLTYLVPREKIVPFLEQHYEYLDRFYQQGFFIASGPNERKDGGVIIVKHVSRKSIQQIIQEDPFIKHKLATAKIIGFEPTKGIFTQPSV